MDTVTDHAEPGLTMTLPEEMTVYDDESVYPEDACVEGQQYTTSDAQADSIVQEEYNGVAEVYPQEQTTSVLDLEDRKAESVSEIYGSAPVTRRRSEFFISLKTNRDQEHSALRQSDAAPPRMTHRASLPGITRVHTNTAIPAISSPAALVVPAPPTASGLARAAASRTSVDTAIGGHHLAADRRLWRLPPQNDSTSRRTTISPLYTGKDHPGYNRVTGAPTSTASPAINRSISSQTPSQTQNRVAVRGQSVVQPVIQSAPPIRTPGPAIVSTVLAAVPSPVLVPVLPDPEPAQLHRTDDDDDVVREFDYSQWLDQVIESYPITEDYDDLLPLRDLRELLYETDKKIYNLVVLTDGMRSEGAGIFDDQDFAVVSSKMEEMDGIKKEIISEARNIYDIVSTDIVPSRMAIERRMNALQHVEASCSVFNDHPDISAFFFNKQETFSNNYLEFANKYNGQIAEAVTRIKKLLYTPDSLLD